MTTRLLTAAVLALCAARPAAAADVSYAKEVKPLLMKYCVECHGAGEKKAGYAFDSFAALMKGGKKGPAVVPGQPDKSMVVRTVEGSAKLMPPKKYGKAPTAQEVATLRAWVAAGAKDDSAAQPEKGAPSDEPGQAPVQPRNPEACPRDEAVWTERPGCP